MAETPCGDWHLGSRQMYFRCYLLLVVSAWDVPYIRKTCRFFHVRVKRRLRYDFLREVPLLAFVSPTYRLSAPKQRHTGASALTFWMDGMASHKKRPSGESLLSHVGWEDRTASRGCIPNLTFPVRTIDTKEQRMRIAYQASTKSFCFFFLPLLVFLDSTVSGSSIASSLALSANWKISLNCSAMLSHWYIGLVARS